MTVTVRLDAEEIAQACKCYLAAKINGALVCERFEDQDGKELVFDGSGVFFVAEIEEWVPNFTIGASEK